MLAAKSLMSQRYFRTLYLLNKASGRGISKASTFEMSKFVNTRESKVKNISRQDLFNLSESSKPKKTLFEDVENIIYLSKSNDDINEAISQINSIEQQNMKVQFNNLLLKALYNLNNTDKALEIFYDKSARSNFNKKAVQMLMEMLHEKKRHGDVIKVFYEYLDEYKEDESKKNGQCIPRAHFDILAKALVKIDSKVSYDIMRQILEIAKQNKSNPGFNSTVKYLHLAILEKDFEEVLNYLYMTPIIKNTDKTVYHNLRAIAFIGLNRVNNATDEINTLLASETMHKKIFPITAQHVNEENTKLSELYKKIKNSGCLTKINLIDYLDNEFEKQIPLNVKPELSETPSIRPINLKRNPKNGIEKQVKKMTENVANNIEIKMKNSHYFNKNKDLNEINELIIKKNFTGAFKLIELLIEKSLKEPDFNSSKEFYNLPHLLVNKATTCLLNAHLSSQSLDTWAKTKWLVDITNKMQSPMNTLSTDQVVLLAVLKNEISFANQLFNANKSIRNGNIYENISIILSAATGKLDHALEKTERLLQAAKQQSTNKFSILFPLTLKTIEESIKNISESDNLLKKLNSIKEIIQQNPKLCSGESVGHSLIEPRFVREMAENPKKCWLCGSPDHLKPDCPKLKSQNRTLRKQNSQNSVKNTSK